MRAIRGIAFAAIAELLIALSAHAQIPNRGHGIAVWDSVPAQEVRPSAAPRATSRPVAYNPDGRPCVTFLLSGAHSTGTRYASRTGYDIRTDYDGWTSGSLTPSVELRLPATESTTLLLGIGYTRWNQDEREPLQITDANGNVLASFTLNNTEDTLHGYLGWRFYFGREK